MADDYPIKYTRAPGLQISYDCQGVSCRSGSVEHDGDEFVCGDCGTTWTDPDNGTLYETWSGEERKGEALDPDDFKTRVHLGCLHSWVKDGSKQGKHQFCIYCKQEREEPKPEYSEHYWIAARDSHGNIRLSQGRGMTVALASDTRADVQGWLDRAVKPEDCKSWREESWYRQYAAALALIDSENHATEGAS